MFDYVWLENTCLSLEIHSSLLYCRGMRAVWWVFHMHLQRLSVLQSLGVVFKVVMVTWAVSIAQISISGLMFRPFVLLITERRALKSHCDCRFVCFCFCFFCSFLLISFWRCHFLLHTFWISDGWCISLE